MYDTESFDKLPERERYGVLPPIVDNIFVCPPNTWSLPTYMQRRPFDATKYNLLSVTRKCKHTTPFICDTTLCSTEQWNSSPFIEMRVKECKNRWDDFIKRNTECVEKKHANKRIKQIYSNNFIHQKILFR